MDLTTLDLASLVIADTATIAIVHPVTQEPIGMKVTVYGSDSALCKKVNAEQSRRRLAKIEKAGKGYTLTSVSPEEREEDAIELLASCTASWEGAVMDGAAVDCSYDNAADLYVKLPWLREQIDAGIGARANFIKG
jgi:hypothetical protein